MNTKWVLLVWVFTGNHHSVQEIGTFRTEEKCLQAREWVNKEGQNDKWRPSWEPQAECFEL